MPARHSLKLPDIELSYLEWNSQTGTEKVPRLLLLHGLADSAVVWTGLGNYLSNHYHVVAPDMRGHGESDKPETGYTFARAIADLEALMAHLNWQNAHIVGHSWTGKLTLIWARQNGDRISSMILVDPIFISKLPAVMKLSLPIVYRKLDCLKCMGPFATLAQAEAAAKQSGEYAGWSEVQQMIFQNQIEQKLDGSWGSKFVIPARNQIFTEVMEVAGLTENIDIPTLFVQPETGVNRMDWQMQPYKTYLQNLTIVKVPGNHWCFLTQPDTFNQTVADFLEGATL
ncbi:MAG: alpha/beta hydrolase [Oscillatoriales cyanobacterium]|uniref:alpha/beta fold hydrolase n=1 Tax=unclassified Microcoleus TaxID=2642155 RepID=UPI001DB1001A|nr:MULTISPECIES: alpha/beta hydrolase [unclassified Microcoleus]TAE51213.1 MAG: alpha/beta hydrolase [Oscillatoriales cyanobacterium]MCC3565780.1 alpha/beta hydrolase [Microcoleus sp. PH2017_31_RDM_U_A]MCC3578525.1 alpha/beta hydrolase [Microcoleus sp. PH2017_32_RDM_D_A]MCC3616482.1 alpha/beta hydrolase [Microcoleus sp. PH2017_38_RDM_U_B]MCC3631256.1 alpha/beta hydrolase [Microcoleus sp. PH2017_39_LGB_O_B]